MKLLLPVDLGQPIDILDLAAYTARRLDAEAQLLTVISPRTTKGTFQRVAGLDDSVFNVPAGDASGGSLPTLTRMALGGPIGTTVETRTQAIVRAEDAARERLQALMPSFHGVPVTAEVVIGRKPAVEIANYVEHNDVGLVLMRTHGRKRLGLVLLGSVAEETVRRVDVPVMLIGPAFAGGAEPRYDELVACVDGSGVSEEILPLTLSARALHMRVTVVTAVASGRGSSATLEKRRYVEHLAEGLRRQQVDASSAVIPGADPAAAIVSYASERPTSIVALTTHARSGVPRLVLGSVAMQVIHASPSPVLVMHARRRNE